MSLPLPPDAPLPPSPHGRAQSRAPLLAQAVATFFGAGLFPRAPGTAGSVASLVIWAPLVLLETSWWLRLLVAAAVFGAGTAAAAVVVRAGGQEDPQSIVIDEVAGMGVTLALASHGAVSLALGFVLFRVFDIWKPWPVRLADRRVKGGFGVMLDDVLAGAYALLALVVIEAFLLPRLVS